MMSSFYLVVWLAVSMADGQATSECPSLNAEKIATVKSLVVAEDVHEKLDADLTDIWGSKAFFDEDNHTCLKYSRKKVDDKVLSQSVHVKGKWFEGEKTRNTTLEKVENGVYYEVMHNLPDNPRFVLAKVYVLYAKNNVFAYFWCLMYSPAADSKEAKLPSLSGIAIRTEHLKTPLDPEVQGAVDEALKKVQAAPALLGEVVHYNPC